MRNRRRPWTYFYWHNGRLEILEPRSMLSAHSIGHGITHSFRDFSSFAALQQAQYQSGKAASSGSSNEAQSFLTAQLTDPNGSATGTVTYQSGSHCGNAVTQFTVSVTGAAASSTLDVSIGNTVVGQITTDANGAGTLTLSSKDSTLPTDFPTSIAAGTVVTVGTLTGTLATSTSSGSDSNGSGSGCSSSSSANLAASLTDSAGSATGTATYSTSNKHGSSVTSFSLSITGGLVGSTLDVAIDGLVVGQLVTDSTGAGSLTLSSKDSTLPANFPTNVSSGSTVTVGTLSGTFATATGSSYSGSLRFARRR